MNAFCTFHRTNSCTALVLFAQPHIVQIIRSTASWRPVLCRPLLPYLETWLSTINEALYGYCQSPAHNVQQTATFCDFLSPFFFSNLPACQKTPSSHLATARREGLSWWPSRRLPSCPPSSRPSSPNRLRPSTATPSNPWTALVCFPLVPTCRWGIFCFLVLFFISHLSLLTKKFGDIQRADEISECNFRGELNLSFSRGWICMSVRRFGATFRTGFHQLRWLTANITTTCLIWVWPIWLHQDDAFQKNVTWQCCRPLPMP